VTRLRVVVLEELTERYLDKGALSESEAEAISTLAGKPIEVHAPSFSTGRRWRLKANGWIGTFRVGPELAIRITPKLPVRNVLGLLQYTDRLYRIDAVQTLATSDSIEDAVTQIATALVRRVERRLAVGLLRRYVNQQFVGPRAVGRLLTLPTALDLAHARPRLTCEMRALRADVSDNRLILYALSIVASIGVLDAVPDGRRVLREIARHVALETFAVDEYVGRQYGRWEQDYKEMHALGALLVRLVGSGSGAGSSSGPVIGVYMPELFEAAVATALRTLSDSGLRVTTWRKLRFGARHDIVFEPDFVVGLDDGRARIVLDAKYKRASSHDASDVQQVVSYATALRCTEAVLVYPEQPRVPLDIEVGPVRVRSVALDLSRDLSSSETELARFVESLAMRPSLVVQ
jgi:5-methylcytosine-specific restriction enzyme subunit McrC